MKKCALIASFISIFIYISIEKFVTGAIFSNVFDVSYKSQYQSLYKYFLNSNRPMLSKNLNDTLLNVYGIINQLKENKKNKDIMIQIDVVPVSSEYENEIKMNHIQYLMQSTIIHIMHEGKNQSLTPLIFVIRMDSSPLGTSTYDSTLHVTAMLEVINTVCNNKVDFDFDFYFILSCNEEFDQTGTKSLLNTVIKNAYYVSFSGFGVGRPLILFSKSNLSSSILHALRSVDGLPMISLINEIPYFKFNSAATSFQKDINSNKFMGAELSFIGNPLLHGTNKDIEFHQPEKHVKLVYSSMMKIITSFKKENDEINLSVFGIAPLVFFVPKDQLYFFGNIFAISLFFYLFLNISIQRLLLTFKCFLSLLFTGCTFFVYFIIISVVNPGSLFDRPLLNTIVFSFTIVSTFILFNKLFHCKPNINACGNSKIHKGFKDQFNEENTIEINFFHDFHFIQVSYLALLLIFFIGSDMTLPILITVVCYFISQLLPLHIFYCFGMILTLLPAILLYSVLFKPLSLIISSNSTYFADLSPFFILFMFVVHNIIFIYPLANAPLWSCGYFSLPLSKAIIYLTSIFLKRKNHKTSETEEVETKPQTSSKETTKINYSQIRSKKNTFELHSKKNHSIRKPANTISILFPKETITSNKLIPFTILILSIYILRPFQYSENCIIRGTSAEYFFFNQNNSEISFIPEGGKKSWDFIWREIRKNNNSAISFEKDFKGRLISQSQPAFVQHLNRSKFPEFFQWPVIEANITDVYTEHYFRNVNLTISNISDCINMIYFIAYCQNSDNKCIIKEKEELYDHVTVGSKETVLRFSGFSKVLSFSINARYFEPLTITIAYQSFHGTPERHRFENSLGQLVSPCNNEFELIHTIFVQNIIV